MHTVLHHVKNNNVRRTPKLDSSRERERQSTFHCEHLHWHPVAKNQSGNGNYCVPCLSALPLLFVIFFFFFYELNVYKAAALNGKNVVHKFLFEPLLYNSVIPFVDGGTEGFKGNVRVILPGMSACIECTLDLFPPQVLYAHGPIKLILSQCNERGEKRKEKKRDKSKRELAGTVSRSCVATVETPGSSLHLNGPSVVKRPWWRRSESPLTDIVHAQPRLLCPFSFSFLFFPSLRFSFRSFLFIVFYFAFMVLDGYGLFLQISFPLCTIAHTPRLPEHCIEYARILQWPKENPFGGEEVSIDGDDPNHISWIYEKALQRAGQYGMVSSSPLTLLSFPSCTNVLLHNMTLTAE